MNFKAIIGADVRCYHETEIEAESPEDARAKLADEVENGHDFHHWGWEPEEIQGDVTIRILGSDDDDFVPAKLPGRPDYSDLNGFVRRMAEFTTPEDDFIELVEGGTTDYDEVEELIADLSDERLCGEYAAFMRMVNEARAILKGIEPAAPAPVARPAQPVQPSPDIMALFGAVRFEPHIPHGSGDAEYRLVAGDFTIATVDPGMVLDDAADLAEQMVIAMRTHALKGGAA